MAWTIQVPPLRARRGGHPGARREHFLDRHQLIATAATVGGPRSDALHDVSTGRGNVRELERVIERAVALAGSGVRLELDDLPPALLGGYADVLLAVAWRFEGTHADVGQPGTRGWCYERCENNKRPTLPRALESRITR